LVAPLIYAWSSQNTAGDTKQKCVNAILFVGASTGNVIGPLLYTQTEAPLYNRGLRSNLALYIVIIILCLITTIYLRWLNKKHQSRRIALGGNGVVVDTSLDSAKEAAAKLAAAAAAAESLPEGQRFGDKAFDDLTDIQNEEFVFVY
jgi:hypothetical protein